MIADCLCCSVSKSLIGLNVHCANSYIPHVQHIIRICCGM